MNFATIYLRRPASALIVVLLHVALIAVLLHATFRTSSKPEDVREIIFRLLRPAPRPERAPEAPRLIRPVAPSQSTVTPPPAQNGMSLQGLHGFLFNCAPENLSNLTPDERAHCLSGALAPTPDETNTLRNQPSRSRDARHWARALARKQNPVLLPCASSQGVGVGITTVICIGKGLASGFGDLDDGPGYGDPPPVAVHVPNNGDPPPPRTPY